jgi:hypothetical protein
MEEERSEAEQKAGVVRSVLERSRVDVARTSVFSGLFVS